MSDPILPLRVSNEALNEPEELQRRIADEGYLFFKGLQDRDKMLSLRRQMMSRLQEVGWIVPGTDPMDGIADISRQCTEGDNEYHEGYGEIYKLEAFHRIAHEPEVTDVLGKIAGETVMPHPQKIARIWFPQYTEHTTPTHQDFVHFQGNFETLTCWSPIGDCPKELGGLAVLPKSHKVGRVLDHHFSLGAGGLNVIPEEHDELETHWHSTDYEVGDALIFPALTIHKALPNVTEDRMRLSLDNRYVALSGKIAEHMLDPHIPSGLNWEGIYPHWSTEDLKYYWENVGIEVIDRDPAFYEKGFEEAIELARAGNDHAIFRLKRTAKNDPDSDFGVRARSVLKELEV